MNILDELKRRKVFRVLASYAVVVFVIMQLVEILFPIFNLPQWTQQFIVILLLCYNLFSSCGCGKGIVNGFSVGGQVCSNKSQCDYFLTRLCENKKSIISYGQYKIRKR